MRFARPLCVVFGLFALGTGAAMANPASCPVGGMEDLFAGWFPPNPFGQRAFPPASACVAAKHDVIVLLGCPNRKDGSPAKCQRARADLAVALSRSGYGDRFIVSGASVHSPGVEAETLRRLLLERGVPASAIVLEPRARHTDENIFYSDVLMAARNWTSALVVTESPGQLLYTAVCDANCCVRRGRLTALRLRLRDGRDVKVGHYARHPFGAPATDAECRHIKRATKLMCTQLGKRSACADRLKLTP